jgi:hypothetical protein
MRFVKRMNANAAWSRFGRLRLHPRQDVFIMLNFGCVRPGLCGGTR